MARKNGRQHSPDEAGRLEKIWNFIVAIEKKNHKFGDIRNCQSVV